MEETPLAQSEVPSHQEFQLNAGQTFLLEGVNKKPDRVTSIVFGRNPAKGETNKYDLVDPDEVWVKLRDEAGQPVDQSISRRSVRVDIWPDGKIVVKNVGSESPPFVIFAGSERGKTQKLVAGLEVTCQPDQQSLRNFHVALGDQRRFLIRAQLEKSGQLGGFRFNRTATPRRTR